MSTTTSESNSARRRRSLLDEKRAQHMQQQQQEHTHHNHQQHLSSDDPETPDSHQEGRIPLTEDRINENEIQHQEAENNNTNTRDSNGSYNSASRYSPPPSSRKSVTFNENENVRVEFSPGSKENLIGDEQAAVVNGENDEDDQEDLPESNDNDNVYDGVTAKRHRQADGDDENNNNDMSGTYEDANVQMINSVSDLTLPPTAAAAALHGGKPKNSWKNDDEDDDEDEKGSFKSDENELSQAIEDDENEASAKSETVEIVEASPELFEKLRGSQRTSQENDQRHMDPQQLHQRTNTGSSSNTSPAAKIEKQSLKDEHEQLLMKMKKYSASPEDTTDNGRQEEHQKVQQHQQVQGSTTEQSPSHYDDLIQGSPEVNLEDSGNSFPRKLTPRGTTILNLKRATRRKILERTQALNEKLNNKNGEDGMNAGNNDNSAIDSNNNNNNAEIKTREIYCNDMITQTSARGDRRNSPTVNHSARGGSTGNSTPPTGASSIEVYKQVWFGNSNNNNNTNSSTPNHQNNNNSHHNQLRFETVIQKHQCDKCGNILEIPVPMQVRDEGSSPSSAAVTKDISSSSLQSQTHQERAEQQVQRQYVEENNTNNDNNDNNINDDDEYQQNQNDDYNNEHHDENNSQTNNNNNNYDEEEDVYDDMPGQSQNRLVINDNDEYPTQNDDDYNDDQENYEQQQQQQPQQQQQRPVVPHIKGSTAFSFLTLPSNLQQQRRKENLQMVADRLNKLEKDVKVKDSKLRPKPAAKKVSVSPSASINNSKVPPSQAITRIRQQQRNNSPSPFAAGHNAPPAAAARGSSVNSLSPQNNTLNAFSPSPKPLTNYQKSMMAMSEIKKRQFEARQQPPASVSPSQQQGTRTAASISPAQRKFSSNIYERMKSAGAKIENSNNNSSSPPNAVQRSSTAPTTTSSKTRSISPQLKPFGTMMTHQQVLLAKYSPGQTNQKNKMIMKSVPMSSNGYQSTAKIAEKVCGQCETAYSSAARFCGVCGKKREWLRN